MVAVEIIPKSVENALPGVGEFLNAVTKNGR
jgi:hypothetical protein